MSESDAAAGLRVEQDDGVMTVTLDRQERMNALDRLLIRALIEAWDGARAPEVRALVVTGTGRSFCSGADLRADPPRPAEAGGLRSGFNPQMLGLAALAKPVLAAVNGVAAGAGLALACAADIRIASSQARFVPSYARIGVVPDMGGTYFIPRLIGWSRAFDWLATSEEISAARALEWGLVNEVVEPDDLLDRTVAKARQLAEMPGAAVGLTKALLQRSWTATLAEQLEHEAHLQAIALADPGRAAAREALVASLGNRGRSPMADEHKGNAG